MKNVTKLTLAALTAALIVPAGVLANDSEWIAIDTHHGSYLYVQRPVRTDTTIAVYANRTGIERSESNASRVDVRSTEVTPALRPMQFTPPQGPSVTYFAPAN